jgi:RNA-directed DNA polymerase
MIFPCFWKKKNEPTSELDLELENYRDKLEERNLPVFYSINHLCLAASVNVDRTFKICESDRIKSYKRFKLTKKRGGYRVIQSPISELKYLQRWILINILSKIESHKSSCGFDKGKSIAQNANVHVGARAILKMDLKRFYDTINEKRVYGIFKAMGYHSNLSVSLAKICTVNPDDNLINSFKIGEDEIKDFILNRDEGLLPQGAPTSPKISNLIARSLDRRLSGLAEKNNLKYSRYADDLTFSGNISELKAIKKTVKHIIKDEHFFVNNSKTRIIVTIQGARSPVSLKIRIFSRDFLRTLG